MTERPQPMPREAFRHFLPIQTRWADNDQYGHINNVTYYAYFDTVVNSYLIDKAGLVPTLSPWIGLVVETRCNYFAPLAFPEMIEAGLVVEEMGRSSVRYRIGIFGAGQDMTAAHGSFVHVYVDAVQRRPMALPEALVAALTPLKA